MTDNEIIKALECCNNGWCDGRCPYYGREDIADCREQSGADQLDLINRQKAEIERHKERCSKCGEKTTKTILNLQELLAEKNAEIERLEFVAVRDKARHKEVLASSSHTIRVLDDLHRQGIKEIKELEGKLKTAKAEAIKEFAEKVKENQRKLFNYIYSNDGFGAIIDNLVKEMVGGTE